MGSPPKYTGRKWKIFTIATAERYLLMKNGTSFSTGNYPTETLLPIHHMYESDNYYGIDVPTISGGPGKIDWWASPKKTRPRLLLGKSRKRLSRLRTSSPT